MFFAGFYGRCSLVFFRVARDVWDFEGGVGLRASEHILQTGHLQKSMKIRADGRFLRMADAGIVPQAGLCEYRGS